MLGDRITYQSHCCKAPVTYDATAEWNDDTQSFELGNVTKDTICQECGDECGAEIVDLETEKAIRRAWMLSPMRWVPAERYDQLHSDWQAQQAASRVADDRARREADALSAYQIDGASA